MAAFDIAIKTLPTYAHRLFTLPQLLTCLALKQFFKTDYHGTTAILADSPNLVSIISIKTTIPPKVGRAPKKYPKKPYRRMMRLHFAAVTYRKRGQVETVFSMIKRNLGYCLYGRTRHSQNCEMFLLAITHNILIVLFLFFKELFHKASFFAFHRLCHFLYLQSYDKRQTQIGRI